MTTPREPEMTPEELYAFYAQPENQIPVGPGVRRTADLTATVPVRFSPAVLEEIRKRAAEDHRSVSSWIRVAIDRELQRDVR